MIKLTKKGFTLIELMIVVVILGILMSTVLPKITGAQARARDAARVADLNNIAQVLQVYYDDYQAYPDMELATDAGDSEAGVGECIGSDTANGIDKALAGYIKGGAMPSDPRSTIPLGGAVLICSAGNAGKNVGKYFYKPLPKYDIARQAYVLCAQAEVWQNATLDMAKVGAAGTDKDAWDAVVAGTDVGTYIDAQKTAVKKHLMGEANITTNVIAESTNAHDTIFCIFGEN